MQNLVSVDVMMFLMIFFGGIMAVALLFAIGERLVGKFLGVSTKENAPTAPKAARFSLGEYTSIHK